MSKKRIIGILTATALCLGMVPATIAAAPADKEESVPSGEGTKIYADYGEGFEFLAELDFGKRVSEEKVNIASDVKAIRVVKGECYELNLDQLTLAGKCPAGYERKLSYTDNDLIEVEDSLDFALSGTGELVIAARSPKKLMGEEYSFKFPEINRGPIAPISEFYSYKVGSHPGAFSMGDELEIPGEDYIFDRIMCHPASGHPDAPMAIYTADDGENLYVFFEAFLDNTFDHGKDFAAVHVRCGDEIKTYKVHTTAENEYGRWYFDYTDSSAEYDWEHMSYVVKVPMSDLTVTDGSLDLAFEYYGTAYVGDRLILLCIGDVSLADKEYGKSDSYPNGYYADADYSLPADGKTLNSMGGDTKSGLWWVTNTGYNDETEAYEYELTLCNANITTHCDMSGSFTDYNLFCEGNISIVLKDGTTNNIGGPGIAANRIGLYCAGYKFSIKGNGTLNVYGTHRTISSNAKIIMSEGAKVNAIMTGTEPYDYGKNCIYCRGVVVDNSTFTLSGHTSGTDIYGLYCYPDYQQKGTMIVVQNDGCLESYVSGGRNANYALSVYQSGVTAYEVFGNSELYEGTAPSGNKVDALTNYVDYDSTLCTAPYVKIVSKKPAEETPEATFTATGTDSGILGNVTTANTYSLDGGTTWNKVTGDNMAITGVTTSKGVQVKLPTADPLNCKDSEAQVIKVTQASKPTGLGKTDLTSENGTGSIKGVTTAMEYRKDGETAYKAVTSTSITGLAAGTYYVRVKASGTVLASPDSAAVVIAPYVTPTATPTSKPTATPTPTVTLTLDKTTANVVCGKTQTLSATVKGTTAAVTWKSSDSKIAAVDNSGKITAKQAGTVTITASVADKNAECKVVVLYKDVTSEKDFWYEPTNYLTEKGVVKGYDKQTKFKPDNDCTRAQMVTFLWRLAGQPAPKSKSTNFKDVKSSDYYYKPVLWAVEKGITTGVSKTKFNPSGVCTRAQTVTFLWRMAGKPSVKGAKNPFKDVKEKDYFYKAVLWASGKKIAAGYKNGTFQPQGKCLRRQMVTFLYKYDKFVNGKG
ncbi:MAG: S-layer homology domain-containing protein [Clostridiales bacterium]|nr:S-layer homology domain-containing protein [Clostridiales bacterium]